jgi:amino acid adenylation domain-containing protein
LSGQDDVVIGTPVANRTRQEVEPLIGFFVNTVALRVRPPARQSVGGFIEQVKQVALQAQQHQQLPFEQVIEAVNPPRSLAHSALFQVMLAWQNAPQGDLELPGLQLQALATPARTVKFDLDIAMQLVQGRVVGEVAYAASLFDASTIRRWLGHWRTLVEQLVQDDAQELARLQLLRRQDREQLARFNYTQQSYQGGSIHELFEAQAARTPDAVALEYEGQQLSYAQLEARANQLARHLKTLGVGANQRVAIALPRSLELVVALLGTLKAGGAYVPLDPAYPAERLRHMLQDSEPVVVLSTETLARSLPLQGQALCCLDGPQPPWAEEPETALGVPVRPHDAAYVIYTSGSTGQPKGVVNAHEAVVNRLRWMQQAYELGAEEVVLQKTPASFDVSVWEFFWPLMCGARLVLARPEGHRDPDYLVELIERTGVSTLHFVPSMITPFLQALPERSGQSLRRIICSGEALPASAVQAVRTQLPWAELHNLYGPTEAAVDVTAWRCTGQETVNVPIGRPIANTRIHILDEQGQEVPIGVAGEIYIAGVQVARGYLHRPGLTAQRFVADPYGGEPGARMYRTGDLGRWREDGSIEYLGRNDHQVKIRGLRIELGEIEAQLQGCEGVRKAVVLARGQGSDQQLVAYITGDASPQALREALTARLPDYMVPAAYVQLDELPLTPNGKLDRRALPTPSDTAFGAHAYVAPEGELESTVAAIWSELLGVQRIGRNDNFFAMGGHSLLAVQVSSRIRTRLGCEVPLVELFGHPTLAGFAQRVAAAHASALPPIVPTPREGALPLSFAQQRLWFLAQLDARAAGAYVILGGVRMKGALDIAALHAALNQIVVRHEALRTYFGSVDGAPVQIIAPPREGLALPQADLSGHSNAEAELEGLAAEEASASFDLTRGPLIRARLIRLASDDHALLVTMHHIVSDGWSMGVLVNEFSALYAAFSQGQHDPLPTLPIQYADYAVWQRRWITGEVLQRQLAFWRDHLSGAPALLELPTDRPRPGMQDYVGTSFGFQLDPELSSNLKALSRRHGTTLFMTLLAAWAALLARLSGQSDVVIGTPIANRGRAEIEPLIGFFVNTQALRVDLSGSPTVAELLAQVRATALAAQEHQDIPSSRWSRR